MIALTEEQEKAKKEIINWFLNSDNLYHFLIADAGCGKSFLTAKVLLELVGIGGLLPQNILVCAPSHQAKKICRKFLIDNELDVDTLTIHSALGLRLQLNKETGQQLLKHKDKKDDPLLGISLLVCDEISMYDDRIVDLIAFKSNRMRFKVLLVGDLKQLPPIGKINFPVQRLEGEISSLTQVLRYSDPEIGEACDSAKIAVSLNSQFSISPFIPENNPNFVRLNEEQAKEKVLECFLHRENTKILAYKNKTVDFYNQLCRLNLYQDCFDVPPQFLIGEQLICNSPVWATHQNSDSIPYFQTGDELIVLSVQEQQIAFLDWQFKRLLLEVESEECKAFISVIAEEDNVQFKTFLKKNKAFHKTLTGKDKRELGEQIYGIAPTLNSDINYRYACTIHKSQGSSFDNVFLVNDLNIRDNRKDARQQFEFMQPRLWYVGLSRTKKRLFVVEG